MGRVAKRCLAQGLDDVRSQRLIDQERVPEALRQQRQRDVGVSDGAGLPAPVLQPAGDQRGLDIVRGDQKDGLA